ncbi:MAG TPA: FeS assembly SUF system protein, partial [Candidatus Pacebacteria bacterium]|nr:FeS assembly SUF system protein [Candidatus Paceibacterota bacterium]
VGDPDTDIIIELTFDPPWTPDMMNEAIRLELGL